MKLSLEVLNKMQRGALVRAPGPLFHRRSLVIVRVDLEQGTLIGANVVRLSLRSTKKRLPPGWTARRPTTDPLKVGAVIYSGVRHAGDNRKFIINELGDDYAIVSQAILLTPENWDGWEWIANPKLLPRETS